MLRRLIRRDGTVSHGFHNPDGTWFEVPYTSHRPSASSRSAPEVSPPIAQSSAPGEVRQFLREIGRRGGKSRAARHTRAEIAEWGRVRRKRPKSG